MRTVLIGSDFMYDSTGNLKPIEINTNVTLNTYDKVESDSDIFDFTELGNFINEKGFTSVAYIGVITQLDDVLKQFCLEKSITYTFYEVGGNSLTVPYVEDNDSILIIRSAYDTTAIIDDTYCADKFNFIQLVGNSTFGIQYALIDSNGTLVNTITDFVDNGVHPNFILKSRYPASDYTQYPKLFKITNQDELNTVIAQNVTNEFLLESFLYNPSKLYNGTHMQIIRSFNLLYPPSLQSISIGQTTIVPCNSVSETVQYDSETHQVMSEYRNSYVTNYQNFSGYPKLRDTDEILMSDGTWKKPYELVAGDSIKTVNIPNLENNNDGIGGLGFQIDLATFNANTSLTDDLITGVQYLNTLTRLCKITFDDGGVWEDGELIFFLVYSDGEVKWKQTKDIQPGDQLMALEKNNTTSFFTELKTVQTVELTTDFFTGWIITVENSHMFIVNDTTHNNTFALFEHNTSCSACTRQCSVQCPACPSKAAPACNPVPGPAICVIQC